MEDKDQCALSCDDKNISCVAESSSSKNIKGVVVYSCSIFNLFFPCQILSKSNDNFISIL